MFKKLMGTLLAAAMVAGAVPAVLAANDISYALYDDFNEADIIKDADDHTYASDDRPVISKGGCIVTAVGTDNTVGIKNGGLVMDTRGKISTVRWNFFEKEVAGDKAVVEFLFRVEKMRYAENCSDLFSIMDKTYKNKVAQVSLTKDTSNTARLMYFKIDSGAETPATMTGVPLFGGDTIFVRFEMNYGKTTEEQGTFRVMVRNLDMGTEQTLTDLPMKGNGTIYPISVAQLELSTKLGDTEDSYPIVLDDLKVYDATNGYAEEPVWPSRVNIVKGLKEDQLSTNADGDLYRAFDDNLDWVNSRWLPTGNFDNPELVMKLDAPKTFDSANVYTGNGSENGVKKFHLEYKDMTTGDWVPITGARHADMKGVATNVYLTFAPVTAQEIKFVAEGTGVRPGVKELRLYQAQTPCANVSLNRGQNGLEGTADFYYYHQFGSPGAASDPLPVPEDGIRFIAASYDGTGRCSDVKLITLPASELTNYHGSNKVTFDVPVEKREETVRLFYWDSFDSLRPLSNAAEISPAA